MTALGGERTSGVHPYNVTPEHTGLTRAIIGPEKWLCVEQKVLLVPDATKAREIARQALIPEEDADRQPAQAASGHF